MTADGSKAIKKTVLSIFSGLLAFASFPPLGASALAWACFVPLFFVVRKSTIKEAFWYSYLAGVVFFGGLLYWLLNVTVPGTIILVLVLGLFYAVFGVLAGIVLRNSMNLFLVSFFWVILEYIRAHLFTGFPWGMLAHSQYLNINLIQIADIMGAYGVSFIVMTFNAALFAYLSRSGKRISYMMFALLFIISATAYGIYRTDNARLGSEARISVIQGNIPQEMKWDSRRARDIISEYSSLTRQAATEGADMIVWPETAYPYLAENAASPAPEISALAEEIKVPILAGLVVESGGRYYNSAALFEDDGRLSRIYRKLHLVPFGEYVPFEGLIGGLRGRIDKPIGNFTGGDEHTLFVFRSIEGSTGPDGSIQKTITFNKFGVLICFEDVFPYLSREFVRKGARILINITNDAWFGDTAAARQHMQSSVFRAVENRVPVIRAANTGVSCFIGPTGKILSGVSVGGRETFVRGYDTCTFNVSNERSYYTYSGDAFVFFLAFLLVAILIMESMPAKAGKSKD
jgi:apolipoprotein N-acyltransferase